MCSFWNDHHSLFVYYETIKRELNKNWEIYTSRLHWVVWGLSDMSGLPAMLRKTTFKLIFIGDSYSDTSEVLLEETKDHLSVLSRLCCNEDTPWCCNGEKLVGVENFPVDTGRCTGSRGMGFSSSNGRWHLQRSNSWHGQHDHHGDQPRDCLLTCLRDYRCASDGTDGTCLLTSHHFQEMMDEDFKKAYRETCLCRTYFNNRLFREDLQVVWERSA